MKAETIKYQGRSFVLIQKLTKNKRVLNFLEKMLERGENLIIDLKPAHFKFEVDKEHNFDKYNVYAYKPGETPRFLITVDRILRTDDKTLKYRINKVLN